MAVKVEELRIGNLVFVDGVERTIVELKTRMASLRFRRKDTELPHQSMFDYQDIVGIPLTEEWLLKFGLEKTNTPLSLGLTHTDFRGKRIVAYLHASGKAEIEYQPFEKGNINDRSYIATILYVHQLQNLFYCLTGQELTA